MIKHTLFELKVNIGVLSIRNYWRSKLKIRVYVWKVASRKLSFNFSCNICMIVICFTDTTDAPLTLYQHYEQSRNLDQQSNLIGKND